MLKKMFIYFQRTLPAMARVRQTRVPNAYDKTALKLEEGDIIKVIHLLSKYFYYTQTIQASYVHYTNVCLG